MARSIFKTILKILVMIAGLLIADSFDDVSQTEGYFTHIYNATEDVFPWSERRLPSSISIRNYKIELDVNMISLTYEGAVTMTLEVTEETCKILFHCHESISLDGIRVRDTDGELHDIKKVMILHKYELVAVVLDSSIPKGTGLVLDVLYHTKLRTTLDGFYVSKYKTEAKEDKVMALTQFQPISARTAFPCFDEPALKATFDISIRTESQYTVRSNMPPLTEHSYTDNRTEHVFQRSFKMSCYLVAFMIAEYEFIEQNTTNNVNVRMYGSHDLIGKMGLALDAHVVVLEYFEEFFGTDFPLPKTDSVGAYDFSGGAMENWGLMYYRNLYLIYDPDKDSDTQKEWVLWLTSHELGHQWYGNIVTMKWWNDIWLNEGFATYLTFEGMAKYMPEFNLEEKFVLYGLSRGLEADSWETANPISIQIDDPVEIKSKFDSITYYKGASLVRLLRSFLGRTVFTNALKSFIRKYKFSVADVDDLWKEFTMETNNEVNIKEMMDTWTLQNGHPILTVTRDGQQFTVTQKQFLYTGSKAIGETRKPWVIPIIYSLDSGAVQREVLSTVSATFTLPEGSSNSMWLKLNWKYKALARVNYDDADWRALIQQLHQDYSVFPSVDRINLFLDAFALAKIGENTYDNAFDLMDYMKSDMNTAIWRFGVKELNILYAKMKDHEAEPYLKDYIQNVTQNIRSHLGINDTGTADEKSLREDLCSLAVKLGDDSFLSMALDHFNRFKNNDEALPAGLRSCILTAAIIKGDNSVWEFMWNRFQSGNYATENYALLSALGKVQDENRLQMYLNYMKTDKIRSQDYADVFRAVAGNPMGHEIAWEFYAENRAYFKEKLAGTVFPIPDIVEIVTSNLKTQADLNKVERLLTPSETGASETNVATAKEKIEFNIKWERNRKTALVESLTNRNRK